MSIMKLELEFQEHTRNAYGTVSTNDKAVPFSTVADAMFG